MPASYVTCPAIALPGHEITTQEIWEDIREQQPNHPKLRIIERVLGNTGVERRRFVRPLKHFSAPGGVADRVSEAFDDALALATTAAQQAMADAGLAPHDIDAIVTSHTTSWSVPNLDIRLINALGLRPDIHRLALATMACAGGVQSLTRAHGLVQTRPGSRVLVVAAEALSSVYHHEDTSMESMIWKALFGDSAGACIVTDTPFNSGLRIDDTWEFVLPHSVDRYSGRIDHTGIHFDSTKAALHATRDVMPHIKAWTKDRVPQVPVVHPGSPRILTDVAQGIGIEEKSMRHSWESLAERGNLGGVAILDIMSRTHHDPVGEGDALLLAFGPGFTAAAIQGQWQH
ncbi:PhlD [Streptomyces sp. NPDC020379]|uniref:PhlD n=1 Tax=Streptomyces sp. NPDC020379 TaxID=3365071 RepID=UPI0037AA2CEA